MPPFTDGELTIDMELVNQRLTLTWRGRSIERDPGKALMPFFAGVIGQVDKGHEVVVDFRPFLYMNSSTVQPILSFCKEVSIAAKSVRVIFDKNQHWQRLSFAAVRTLSTVWGNVSVEGVEK
jgi:hypothetical protein